MKKNIIDKIKEVFTGPHRHLAWFITITSVVFILLWIVGPGNTFGHWIGAKRKDKEQQEEILRLKNANAELDRQIEMMSNNKDSLEKFAREQYYFAEPEEDVFIY